MERAEILTHAEFADLFIERITQFVQRRPAYLSLLAAPIRFRRDPAARKASRIVIANAFQAKNPSLSKEQSLLAANVSLQIARGMMTLYGEADPKGKVLVVAEFKKVLTLYLGSVLSEETVPAKEESPASSDYKRGSKSDLAITPQSAPDKLRYKSRLFTSSYFIGF